MSELATLILAAGESRRFDGIKQLAQVNGQTLLARCLTLAEQLTPGAVHLVLGAHHEAIVAALSPLLQSTQIIQHATWQQGMGSSLAAGMCGLQREPDGVLILLADQLAVEHASLQRLCAAWRQNKNAVCCATYAGGEGVPALFPRRLFAALKQLQGNKGAKDLLRHEGDALIRIAMPEAAIDIDTSEDLTRFLQEKNTQ